MRKKTDGIEKYPVEKRQIRAVEPPPLIFFDVDEDEEEAEFIRVDDLFKVIDPFIPDGNNSYTFTLIPRRKTQIIDSKTSRLIHKTMILTAFRLLHPIEKIRIRPMFVQWQLMLEEADDPEKIVREFRFDLENQFGNLLNYQNDESFLADTCFVCPTSANMTDSWICQMAETYQQEDSGR